MNELQTFSSGDTNYIQKHNANYANLKAAVDALETNLAAQVAAASGPGSAFDALFGPTAAIIGADSYAMTGSGDVLTVAAGFNWKPSIPMVVRNPASTTLSFTGLAAGTYYIYADKTGAPVRSTTAGAEDIYSVAWTGSAFGAIVRLAPIVWGAADDFAAQVSAALGQTFTTLDARLEAGEAAAAGGALARAWQIGKLDKDISGSTDVTLSAVEANNTVINLTGALTANINVILPVGANSRLWAVTNNTIGAYTVTMKGALGAGAVVAQGSKALFGQDGTNVFALGLSQQAINDAVTAHEAEPDPHPQYLTQTEADSRYTSSTAATGVSSVNGHAGVVTLGASDVGAVASSALGAANGAASLDSGGKLPASQLPDLAIIDFLGTVANQTAMLVLSGQKGDWCARSDNSKVYVITGSDPTQVGSWTALSYPTGTGGTVTSVALTTPGLLFNVSGSPVTGAGTLAFSLKTQTANTFLAGPTTGADATPTMRALTAADLPVMVASGAGHAGGAVPDPGSTAGTTRYLREDGTWQAPSGSGTPGGSTTQLQFNDAGGLGGASALNWDKANNILYVGAGATAGNIQGGAPAADISTGVSVTVKGGTGGVTNGTGGAVNITGGTGGGGSAAGGDVVITGGQGVGAVTSSSVRINGGPAPATAGSRGGGVLITAANGTSTGTGSGGGDVTITAGNTVGTVGATAGGVSISAGSGNSSGTSLGGSVTISSGNGGANVNAGAVNITGGSGGTTNGIGGAINITAGSSGTSKDGGVVTIKGGTGGTTTGNGGAVNVTAGSPAAGNGGAVNITASAGVGTNKNGGNVNLTPGAATGTGTPGNVVLNNSGAALATTAIGGFTCIPTCAGAPTGTPANIPTGTVPMVFDTTNSKFWIYTGGAWKGAVLS